MYVIYIFFWSRCNSFMEKKCNKKKLLLNKKKMAAEQQAKKPKPKWSDKTSKDLAKLRERCADETVKCGMRKSEKYKNPYTRDELIACYIDKHKEDKDKDGKPIVFDYNYFRNWNMNELCRKNEFNKPGQMIEEVPIAADANVVRKCCSRKKKGSACENAYSREELLNLYDVRFKANETTDNLTTRRRAKEPMQKLCTLAGKVYCKVDKNNKKVCEDDEDAPLVSMRRQSKSKKVSSREPLPDDMSVAEFLAYLVSHENMAKDLMTYLKAANKWLSSKKKAQASEAPKAKVSRARKAKVPRAPKPNDTNAVTPPPATAPSNAPSKQQKVPSTKAVAGTLAVITLVADQVNKGNLSQDAGSALLGEAFTNLVSSGVSNANIEKAGQLATKAVDENLMNQPIPDNNADNDASSTSKAVVADDAADNEPVDLPGNLYEKNSNAVGQAISSQNQEAIAKVVNVVQQANNASSSK